MEIYSMKEWKRDGTFKARPGQEVSEQVYNIMLNCLPPKDLPADTAARALQEYATPIHAGFLMGEPHDTDSAGRTRYLAFGMNDYGKGPHYYYLGPAPAEKKKLHGSYYYMDCMNAFVNNGLFPESEFKNEAEAIQTAANYEATLYKFEYKNGERISSRTLYDPL